LVLSPSATRWISSIIRIASSHPEVERVLDTVARLAERPVRTSFLLLGEPGTGKEGLARTLHALVGKGRPLVQARVSGFDAAHQHHELLAPRTGAMARARGGMVLIDELTDLHPTVQVGLYGALKQPDSPHLIALSDVDASAAVASGRLRHDLYWRVARIVLTLPPLRERLEDIPAAAIWMGNRILRLHGEEGEMRLASDADAGAADIVLSDDAVEALKQHRWSGNFRELEAVLERALLLYCDQQATDRPTALSGAAVRLALCG
jgi:DNA-binding NtrC family response regulator